MGLKCQKTSFRHSGKGEELELMLHALLRFSNYLPISQRVFLGLMQSRN
jgi:hypothetical protein